MSKMVESQYFAQIRDPVEIRRSILGSSRQIITVLQRYEHIKALRVKKLEKITKLRALNKEINLAVAKLKQKFPAVEMRVKVGHEEKHPRRASGSRQVNELQKLEDELRQIEHKIGQLG
ncbi:hypothetical protein KY362_04865 [Candidatus Woesearchaeota archaeon]|nr:hypothetical protein [Candidatus Woesearchaeota archaeon]